MTMNENIEGNPETQNPGGEQTPPNQPGEGQPQSPDLQTALGQKKHFQEKSAKLEGENVELKKELATFKMTPQGDDQWKKRMDFVVSNRDLSKDEVDEVIAYADGKKISYDDALKSPFVSKGLQTLRSEKRSEQVTPPPSRPVVSTFGSPTNASYNPPKFEGGKSTTQIEGKDSFQEWRGKRRQG